MRALLTTLFAAFALAAGATAIRPVPAPTYLDSESGVAAATDQQIPSQSGYGFRIDFAGTPSNNVEVAMGKDEAQAIAVGWDCDRYFVRRTADHHEWSFPVTTSGTNRWLEYICGVKSGTARSLLIKTPEGALAPSGVVQAKRHTLKWIIKANNPDDGTYTDAYLGQLSLTNAGAIAQGSGSALGRAVGSPGIDLTSDRPFTVYEGAENCVVFRSYSNETTTVTAFVTAYEAAALRFGWSNQRVTISGKQEFDFYVDDAKVASAKKTRLPPSSTGRSPHTVRIEFRNGGTSDYWDGFYAYFVGYLNFADRTIGARVYEDVSDALGCSDLRFTGDWYAVNGTVRCPALPHSTSSSISTVATFTGLVDCHVRVIELGHGTTANRVRLYVDDDLYSDQEGKMYYDHLSANVPDGSLGLFQYTFSSGTQPTGREWDSTGGDLHQKHTLRWVYSRPSWGSSSTSYTCSVGNLRFTDREVGTGSYGGIGAALGFPDLQFSGTWYPFEQTAMISGVERGKTAEFSTVASFSGSVSFDWKADCYSYDTLTFYVDGTRIKEITGPIAWTSVTATPGGDKTRPPDWAWQKDWDTITLTTRGVGATNESATYHIDQSGGLLMLR